MAYVQCRECGNSANITDAFCSHCGVRSPTVANPLAALDFDREEAEPRSRQSRKNSNAGVLSGVFSCVFGLLGIFTLGLLFVPLAVLFGIIGLLTGLTRQSVSGAITSILGLFLAFIAFISSPSLLILAGTLLVTSQDQQPPRNVSVNQAVKNQPTTPIVKAETFDAKRPPRTIEPFEGLWVQSASDCLDEDGPNSRTLIDLSNMEMGQPAPLFDRYENHCSIQNRITREQKTILNLVCFEFWEDYKKRSGGRYTAANLERVQSGDLQINGKLHRRCPQAPVHR